MDNRDGFFSKTVVTMAFKFPLSAQKRWQRLFGYKVLGKVIIDEVQKAPALLNSIHSLIEESKTHRFILLGPVPANCAVAG
jgi:hypothetical protein